MDMKAFRERAQAFESKFAYDEELKFRAEVRRNKLMALWAANILGRPDADAYSTDVLMAAVENPVHANIVNRLRDDLNAAGFNVRETELQTRMEDLMVTVVEEMKAA
jgi:hypothetical protein